MRESSWGKSMRCAAAMLLFAFACTPVVPAIKNMAVVASAGSKLSDVPLADLIKYCKGTAKAWPDGKNFVIVLINPDAPDMHIALQKLFGGGVSDAKVAIAKLNETRQTVGIVDVYSINSSVKVLRIDGKLPFDVGYALKGN